MYIELEKGERIPMGNFSFLYAAVKDEKLFKQVLKMESLFRLDYYEFAQQLRISFEAIALFEEIKRRKKLPGNEDISDDAIRREIIDDIVHTGKKKFSNDSEKINYVTYKGILNRIAGREPERYRYMLEKYHFLGDWKTEHGILKVDYSPGVSVSTDVLRKSLKSFIFYLYDFGSKAIHKNEDVAEMYRPTPENCRRVISSFHDFLCAFYDSSHRFRWDMLPVGKYFPVPEEICSSMGLNLRDDKRLFVKEGEYYLLLEEDSACSLKQIRENEAIRELWVKSYTDPTNVIRSMEKISSGEGMSDFQVLSIPGRPIALTREFIMSLSAEEKMNLIQGMIRGVNSLHSCSPPIYHRNLNPQEFLVFQIQGHYKILLIGFAYSKQIQVQPSDKSTVYFNLKKKAENMWENDFFAPELRKKDIDNHKIDWQRADIFSLGQMMIYILTGYAAETIRDVPVLLRRSGMRSRKSGVLGDMLSWYPEDRPDIKKIAAAYLD